jgi:hypothetical protein
MTEPQCRLADAIASPAWRAARPLKQQFIRERHNA